LVSFLALVGLLGGCASPDTLSSFSTDGCSRFPDRSVVKGKEWCLCCVAHDRAYWRGGTAEERRKADEALRACVQERTGDAGLAALMYTGVRIGGSPYWPTRFRWGYGWGYGRYYRSLTPAESAEADQRVAEYEAGIGLDHSPGRPMFPQNRKPLGVERP
jgi:hypothetical protein